MKRKSTKEILVESFREIAEKKNIDKITVNDIVKNCDYSPATFYRHFTDKYDLIAWDYTHNSLFIMNNIGKDGYKWRDTLKDAAEYFYENRDYLKNLLIHTSGHDAFVKYMSSLHVDYLINEAKRVSGTNELPYNIILLIKIYCYGTVQLSCEWITGAIDMTPELILEAYEESVPAALAEYLYDEE